MSASEYIAELIEKQLAQDIVVPSDAATAVIEEMEKRHPGEFGEWLRLRAHQTLRVEITTLIASRRTRGRSRAVTFRESTEDAASGLFAVRLCVSESFEQKRIADMTGPEHLFVAGQYEGSANKALMEAAFHRAVAKKVGKKRTADVLTEEQCELLYRTVTSNATGRVA